MAQSAVGMVEAQTKIRWAADSFLRALEGVSEAQWLHRPETGGWSMSEVTEHVAFANRALLSVLSKRLTGPLSGPLAVEDDEIPFLFYGGGNPPPTEPLTGSWTDIGAALDAFDTSSRAVVDWSDAVDLDLRSHGFVHPVFGLLDGVQWMLFIYAHTARHRADLLDLKRSPDLPRA